MSGTHIRASHLVLVALTLTACVSGRRGNTLEIQPELAPKVDLRWEDGMDESSGRLTVDVATDRWAEKLEIGGQTVPPGSALQIVVADPYSESKQVYLHDPATGSSVSIDFEKYVGVPSPNYEGFVVVPEYSREDEGIWLHLLVGTKASEGVRVLVKTKG